MAVLFVISLSITQKFSSFHHDKSDFASECEAETPVSYPGFSLNTFGFHLQIEYRLIVFQTTQALLGNKIKRERKAYLCRFDFKIFKKKVYIHIALLYDLDQSGNRIIFTDHVTQRSSDSGPDTDDLAGSDR